VLLEVDGKPVGGKWTYDAENRAKFPKKEIVPEVPTARENAFLIEARAYVEQHFPQNYGTSQGPHLFAIDFEESEKWLTEFLEHRFEKFGIYEDAIVTKEPVLYHSVLSPMLNIGLLQPNQILDACISFAQKRISL